ncbi:hypothetical protein PSQ90_10805 [Devosia rhodophyticola]|uniref:Uncharacterized protein n=1 Tax=Devosia rhodophyticola TaxID=3026423 RepID=A0ABY7YUC3_9HYPH|nr:hypothetical protein [Devosia rhodophyticola]WDR04802.1 hypothetical protein PSQ90_10805 [Devosia rhodophyticola]
MPEPDRRGLEPDEVMKRFVDEAHRCGVKFQGRVELDADWMGMIDYDSNFMESVVRDLDYMPVTTWWEHRYKGHPAYHYCTNAPGYRAYLIYQLERVVASGVDWLMIDSAIPTIGALSRRYGGCFCDHCMSGFKSYLGHKLSKKQLAEHGISTLYGFDYRTYLRDKGVTSDQYREETTVHPLPAPSQGIFRLSVGRNKRPVSTLQIIRLQPSRPQYPHEFELAIL